LIYLDQATTSFPKRNDTVQAICDCLSNPDSTQEDQDASKAKNNLAQLFRISNVEDIALCESATTAIGMLLNGLLGPGDHVVCSSVEHDSVVLPLEKLQKSLDIKISYVATDKLGRLKPSKIKKAIKTRTQLVIINHGCNVIGTVQPLAQIKDVVGSIPLMVDAAQTAGHCPIDLEKDGIDILVFSGHKALLGPRGVGGFYLHPNLAHSLERRCEYIPTNTAAIAGLASSTDFLIQEGIERIHQKTMKLFFSFLEKLRTLPGITLYGPEDSPKHPYDRLPIVSFRIDNKCCAQISRQLEEDHQIIVGSGLHQSTQAHKAINTHPDGTVRLSAGIMTSEDDYQAVLSALAKNVK
jgi:selenocysteine lyase/cysteine desulfurase